MVKAEDRMNTPDNIEGGLSFGTVDKLMQLMKIGDPGSRERSARALGELLDRKCVPVLIEALKDEDITVRKSALHALSKIKDPSSIGAITCALSNR
jgi:HEAT repeat protein